AALLRGPGRARHRRLPRLSPGDGAVARASRPRTTPEGDRAMSVEERLRQALEHRAGAVSVGDGWARIGEGVGRRRRRWPRVATGVALSAVAAAVVLGVLAAGRGGGPVQVIAPGGDVRLWFLRVKDTPTLEIVDL